MTRARTAGAVPGAPTTQPRPSPSVAPGVVEVFAGVGSVAAGFVEVLGGDIILLNDVDPLAKQAAKDNLGEDVLYDDGDVRELTGERVVDAADGRDVTALLGCPPCQGWSAAGLRQSNDARNLLLGEFFRLVRELTPRFFVMENVAGVAGRSEFAGALASVNDRYSWWAGVLNSASYGLPQTRQRTLALGYRRDLGVNPTAPKPTHGGARGVWDYRSESLMTPSAETLDAILGSAPRVQPGRGSFHSMTALYDDIHDLPNFVTVEDAIGDLDGNDPSEYSLALRGAGPLPVPVPDDHVAWGHGPDLVRRLALVREGRRPPKEATNGTVYYSQAYARLHRRGLARTVTTNFHNPGSGRFTHYRRDRTLTVREAARLQGFPDSFRFPGTRSAQARLVGNAFPLLWAKRLAEHVRDELGDALH